jgi:hypothetical protein
LKISKGGNQIPYIEEEQITQWPKEKAQKDKLFYSQMTVKKKELLRKFSKWLSN